jgi:hypothetical protein
MTKNKTIYVALRMNELEVSKLDYIRQSGETRSGAIRRLINEAWFDEMMRFDQEHGSSISDRVNCL